jgi:acetolactate decarboxylase
VPELRVTVSSRLWQALQTYACANGEPLGEIVGKALSDYLQVTHSTVYQVSTSTALVEGVYQGAVRIETLREHGDMGLGTFEHLDGEMVVVDGRFFQVRSDGSVHECADDVLSPFAVITHFTPEPAVTIACCPDLSELTAQFDRLRHSDNLFYALRVDGHFDAVHTRAMCWTEEGVPLLQAAAEQPEFELRDVVGTLVGFWSPGYTKTMSVPGYHLHFLSYDRKSGGHLLQCRGRDWRLQIQKTGDYRIVLPATDDFLKADLSRDGAADLEKAEREQH